MSAMRRLFRARVALDVDIGAIDQDASIYARWDGGETEQDARIEQEYRGYIAHKIAFMIVFAVLSFIAGGLVITYGDYPLNFFEVYGIKAYLRIFSFPDTGVCSHVYGTGKYMTAVVIGMFSDEIYASGCEKYSDSFAASEYFGKMFENYIFG